MATKRKKKKRRGRGGSSGPRKSGVMMGMRSGFKSVARSVGVGEEEAQARKSKTKSLLGTAFTVVLVAAAAFMLYRRFG